MPHMLAPHVVVPVCRSGTVLQVTVEEAKEDKQIAEIEEKLGHDVRIWPMCCLLSAWIYGTRVLTHGYAGPSSRASTRSPRVQRCIQALAA